MKPCPFCGNIKDNRAYCIDGWGCRVKNKETMWAVECNNCIAEGPWGNSATEAVALWDQRIVREPLSVEKYYKD